MIYDIPSSSLKPLDVEGENPAWAPDNTRLAFDHSGRIHIYDLTRESASELGAGADPSWSPDSSSIAARDGYDRVDLIDVKTRMRVKFLEGRLISVPRWSPNGEWMMYTRSGGGRWWSIGDMATEPHQIVVRQVKTGTEAVVGRFLKGNRGNYTWTTNPALCRQAGG
jgi:Tol biopolymer transport system component